MAKRKVSKSRSIFASVISLVIGIIISLFAFGFLSLPESYIVPEKVQGSNYVSSTTGIDSQVVSNEELSIHFLELGNKYTGDCTLIKVGNTEILIDAGSKASSIPFIEEYLNKYVSDGKLEYVVVTHAHEDHYAGFATNNGTDSLFDKFEIGTIIEFAQTNQTLSKKLYSNYIRERDEAVSRGAECFTALECVNNLANNNGKLAQSKYELGESGSGISMQILYQKFYEEHATTENNYSVCLQIVQGQNKYLFTGDLEAEGESSLVDENQDELGKVQLYKAGHHGSKTSSSTKLMDIIQPEIVCVCCCAGSSEYTSKNENQFPTQDFINRVSVHTDQIYVTTICLDYSANKFESFNGTIVICASKNITSTEIDIKLFFSNNSTKLKNTEWFAKNRTLPVGVK